MNFDDLSKKEKDKLILTYLESIASMPAHLVSEKARELARYQAELIKINNWIKENRDKIPFFKPCEKTFSEIEKNSQLKSNDSSVTFDTSFLKENEK